MNVVNRDGLVSPDGYPGCLLSSAVSSVGSRQANYMAFSNDQFLLL